MALTYSQKRFIQEHYPRKTTQEISSFLGVSEEIIKKHVSHNTHLLKTENTEESPATDPYLILNLKKWIATHWINLLVLFFLIIIAYINAFHAELVSDDITAIRDQEKILKTPQYFLNMPTFIPRTILYYIAYQIGGLNPFWYRIWNILFHIGVVWSIYALIPFFTKRQLLPFMIAALAAVHPMMIESVTWISGGIYAQSVFFLLISFILYLVNEKRNSIKFSIASMAFFVLALSCSEKTIIFPVILLFYEFTFHKLGKTWKKVIPYFVIAVIWVIILIPRITPRISYLQRTYGAENAAKTYNPFVQVPVAITSYLQLFAWPDKLTLYHSEFKIRTQEYLIMLGFFLSYLAIWGYMFFKNRTIFFWMGFFMIALAPTLNPFGLSWLVAERYSYLGSIGLYFVVAYLINKLAENKTYKAVGYIIFVLLIITLTIRTLMRNAEWKNVDTLWVATGRTSPSDPKTHNNLGDMYARHGDYKNAEKEFKTAIALNSSYAAAYHNLANTYKLMGNDAEAIKFYEQAATIDPTIWQSYENIGSIYFKAGNFPKAIEYIDKAYRVDKNNPNVVADFGVIYLNMGDREKAKEWFARALKIDPENKVAQAGYAEVTK